ncbi:ROK family protein [Curtobacterium sp. MCBD17_019]|uniref:ROK family protein n=1 Tax=Curtobacterium sp. MCBD17_019 TaxID=2175669 RepID=UPI000DA7B802|nr:ROK family protein [Curtobacterium sp. MCBD17_019]PZE76534.1 transcriptional regulator [Curtobacterium sp. MCBD17_019]
MAEASASQARRKDLGRHQNLTSLLRRVHATPATRSDLTRFSGLNRSTVAGLVGELVDRGLVVEDEVRGAGSVGRPSPTVRPADRAVGIAVHPEIDAVRVAAVLLGGRVVRRVRVDVDQPPTPERVATIAQEAVAAIRADLPPGAVVVGAGVAVPGLVRVADGVVRLAPHLDWHDVPLAAQLASALDMPVRAANEASLGAAAEWVFGAGRGADDLLYVNGGASGIGGGIVTGGVPLLGASGHAGEIGHVSIRTDGSRDSAGLVGTLEAAVTRARLAAVLDVREPDPDTFERMLLAATEGGSSRSSAVVAEVERQIDTLAIALASVVNVLGSERIVLGGFLAALAAADGPRLRSAFDAHLLAPLVPDVQIRRAELGADILLIGAASLPLEHVLTELPTLG